MYLKWYAIIENQFPNRVELLILAFACHESSFKVIFSAHVASSTENNSFTIDTRYVTEEKYRVIYAGLLDPSKFHCDKAVLEFTRVMFMLTLKKGICPGYVFVLNMKGMSLSHLSTLSVTLLKDYLYFVQEAIPLKVRGLHMANSNSFMEKLMIIMKPFLKKELYDVISMHTDMNKMFKTSNVKSEFLPKEVGGQSPISRAELIADIRTNLSIHKDEIHEMMAKRTDRKKRASDNKYSYEVEVLKGSFRKLEVD